MELKELSSNWKKLRAVLKAEPKPHSDSAEPRKLSAPRGEKRKRADRPASFQPRKRVMATPNHQSPDTQAEPTQSSGSYGAPKANKPELVNEGLSPTTTIGKYVALDCEMVGVGPDPDRDSALARVSVVNYNGDQIYDSYVRPKEQVTDWRTRWSGVTPKHMSTARSFEQVQADIAKLLDGNILIGHAISNDLNALYLGHPKRDIRDTSKHPAYRRISAGSSPRLKLLASELLGIEIQSGAHSSVEDARACMLLFRRDKGAFEKEHAKKWPVRQSQSNDGESTTPKKTPKKKKKKGKR
ncbi:MAG: hypothetical protein Q9160_006696 [Pyrenula sp. 1 TL-2023]